MINTYRMMPVCVVDLALKQTEDSGHGTAWLCLQPPLLSLCGYMPLSGGNSAFGSEAFLLCHKSVCFQGPLQMLTRKKKKEFQTRLSGRPDKRNELPKICCLLPMLLNSTTKEQPVALGGIT